MTRPAMSPWLEELIFHLRWNVYLSHAEIAEFLDELGVPTTTRGQGRWQRGTVQVALARVKARRVAAGDWPPPSPPPRPYGAPRPSPTLPRADPGVDH